MGRRIVYVLVVLALLDYPELKGQSTADSLFATPESTQSFTLNNLYKLILMNHPVAKQAGLLSDVARQEIRLARGSFDPKLEAELASKRLNGKEYYDIFNSSIKFPLRVPIEPSAGVDRSKGAYLNPERYIDNTFDYRQFYAGISLPLGRGLLTDERRTALRQAELFQKMMEAEQVKVINKLLLDAAKSYWDWYYAYHMFGLLNRSLSIAEEVFNRVKMNHRFGEAAAIDTIQAKITRQQRFIEQREAFLNLKNSGIELSNMLWDSISNPLDLGLSWAPVLDSEGVTLGTDDLKKLTDYARINHPELKKIDVKISQMEVDRKLAVEYMKPLLNLNYYAINQPVNPGGNFSFTLNDNYKFGFDFSLPVFLRKERSKVALAKLKIVNAKYEQCVAERQIVNNLMSVYNQLVNSQLIITGQKQVVENYERLFNAELVNLERGESDLFKINVQQEKLIQAQTKWLKQLVENEKQKAYLYWAAGTYRINN